MASHALLMHEFSVEQSRSTCGDLLKSIHGYSVRVVFSGK